MKVIPSKKDDKLTVSVAGRLDALTVPEFEKQLAPELRGIKELVLDFEALEYISSAGLRLLMKLRKRLNAPIPLINVSREVYEILETTGFTELFDVEKKLRELSVEGMPCIGKGANGSVYRMDDEHIVKVYNPVSNTFEMIKHEKTAARQAFIHDIPSAISYDIVMVGDRYGMIYEMINAGTLGEVIANDPDNADVYARRMAELLKKLHSTEFDEGVLPDARSALMRWAEIADRSGCYDKIIIDKLRDFIMSIPAGNTFVHGDFHPGNIMVADGEFILIDMGDASMGDPIIDLLGSYHIMRLITRRRGGAERYTGIPEQLLGRVWNVFMREYTGLSDEKELAEYEMKLKFYSIIRSFAGVTFSELVPKEALPHITKEISEAFLAGLEKMNS